MTKTTTLTQRYFPLAIPIFFFSALALLIQSSLYQTAGTDLSPFITIDLLLTVPLLYFLMVRKTEIPNLTVMPVLVTGLLIGTFLLPAGDQTYLNLFKSWGLPVIELGVMMLVGLKIRKAILAYRKLKGDSPDFYTTVKVTCAEVFPGKVANPMAGEITLLYYSFFTWKKRPVAANEFTHHKRSGTKALLGVFIMIIAIETAATHLLLSLWSPILAYILIALSVYSMFQFFGFIKSLSQRRSTVTEDELTLRFGMMNETTIPLAEIENIEYNRASIKGDHQATSLSLLGEFEGHNAIITCRSEQVLYGLYVLKKTYLKLALNIDDKDKFTAMLMSDIEQ